MLDNIRDIRAVNYYTTVLEENEQGIPVLVKKFIKYELQVLPSWAFTEWKPIEVIEVNINEVNNIV
jgi:hypothetical protein